MTTPSFRFLFRASVAAATVAVGVAACSGGSATTAFGAAPADCYVPSSAMDCPRAVCECADYRRFFSQYIQRKSGCESFSTVCADVCSGSFATVTRCYRNSEEGSGPTGWASIPTHGRLPGERCNPDPMAKAGYCTLRYGVVVCSAELEVPVFPACPPDTRICPSEESLRAIYCGTKDGG
jgi:hypothetical protein